MVSENGSSLLDFCKQTGYILLNGRAGTDNLKIYKKAGSSLVDYVMSRSSYLKYESDFEILPPTIYSDHCQVFNIKFKCTPLVKYMTKKFNVDKKLVWEAGKALEFTNELRNMANVFIDVFKTDIDYGAEINSRMLFLKCLYHYLAKRFIYQMVSQFG